MKNVILFCGLFLLNSCTGNLDILEVIAGRTTFAEQEETRRISDCWNECKVDDTRPICFDLWIVERFKVSCKLRTKQECKECREKYCKCEDGDKHWLYPMCKNYCTKTQELDKKDAK